MLPALKQYFRKRALRKIKTHRDPGLLPITDIKTALCLINIQEPGYVEATAAVQDFYFKNGITGAIEYIDLADSNINWYGKPKKEKNKLFKKTAPDLLISLVNSDDFYVHYLIGKSNARYKIGRKRFPGEDTLDMVVADGEKEMMPAQALKMIINYMSRIEC